MADDGWIKTDRGWRKSYGPVATDDDKRAVGLSCPRFISDTMEPTEHVDGKHYTSKSAFRAVTKANGYIEVGDDPARHKRPGQAKADPKQRRAAVEKAVSQVLT